MNVYGLRCMRIFCMVAVCCGFGSTLAAETTVFPGKSATKAPVEQATAVLAVTPKLTAINAVAEIAGKWTANGGLASIESEKDGTIKVTNETKLVSKAKLSGGMLVAADWNVTAQLSQDKNHLVWSNGADWLRQKK